MSLAGVLFSAGSVMCASAADLGDSLKDGKIPEVGPVSWKGFDFFGVVDVAAQYETHGVPYKGIVYSPAGLISALNNKPLWVLGDSQSTQSFAGVKTVQELGYDTQFLGRAEVGFNPTHGDLANGPGSVQKNNGVPAVDQFNNGDAPRAGQFFNGQLYAGFSNGTLGTVTAGRINNLLVDQMPQYDGLSGYGFTLLAYSTTPGGGGTPETGRMDEAVKYSKQIGLFTFSALYAAPDTATKQFAAGNAEFKYKGLAIDGYGSTAKDSKVFAALNAATEAINPHDELGGRVFDADSFAIMGRYKFDLSTSPGFKDEIPVVTSSLTFFSGFDRVIFRNASDPIKPGFTGIGGYQFGPQLSTNGSVSTGIVNDAYTGGDRIFDTWWLSAQYKPNLDWTLGIGYYHQHQNSYGFGVPAAYAAKGLSAPIYSATACSDNKHTNCSGHENSVGFRADYQWTRNLTVYAGANYSAVADGMAFGFLQKNAFDPTVGLRFAW
jgi:predicted porin